MGPNRFLGCPRAGFRARRPGVAVELAVAPVAGLAVAGEIRPRRDDVLLRGVLMPPWDTLPAPGPPRVTATEREVTGVRQDGREPLKDGPAVNARTRRDFTHLAGHAGTLRATTGHCGLPTRVIIFVVPDAGTAGFQTRPCPGPKLAPMDARALLPRPARDTPAAPAVGVLPGPRSRARRKTG